MPIHGYVTGRNEETGGPETAPGGQAAARDVLLACPVRTHVLYCRSRSLFPV